MNPRVEYEMSEADLKELLKACRPTPAMYGSGGQTLFGDPQENANRAWAALGKKMGFEPMTVRPVSGKGTKYFTAVPSETPEQRQERERLAFEEFRVSEINRLNSEIDERQKKLAELEGAR